MAQFTLMVVCFIMAATLPSLCNGFAPHLIASMGALASDSCDHREITEEGALIMLKQFFLNNENKRVSSSSAIRNLQEQPQSGHPDCEDITAQLKIPTSDALFRAYYLGSKEKCGFLDVFTCSKMAFYRLRYLDTILTIQRANSDVDSSESKIAKAHFDNEEIWQGNKRLQEKRERIIKLIQQGKSLTEARKETGRALHTLQDFYSHSNWVELGNTEPLKGLGQPGFTPTNIASPTTPTCNDNCIRQSSTFNKFVNPFSDFVQSDHEYDCTQMQNIKSEILSKKILTSGWYGHDPDADRSTAKPSGKCSHGGAGDYTSDTRPKGGINKDMEALKWSPHAHLHYEAAKVAIKATGLFLQSIRDGVNNDAAFAKFLKVERKNVLASTMEQEQSSIAFVVDTVESMVQELSQIQTALPLLESRLASYQNSHRGDFGIDYILVQVNDPGTIQTTQSLPVLSQYISELAVSQDMADREDCREASLEAVVCAARHSREGGVINVFTQCKASDVQHLGEAMALIQEKNLKINIFKGSESSSTRRHRRNTKPDSFHQLATMSGDYISSNDLSAVHQMLPSLFKPTTSILFLQAGPAFSGTVEFLVDSTVTEFQITVNGNDLQIRHLEKPHGQDILGQTLVQVQLSSPTSYVVTVRVSDDSYFGTWRLAFNSSSSYQVYITGDSHLSFASKLYRRIGEMNRAHPGRSYGEVMSKALSGKEHFMVIAINDDMDSIQTGSLIDAEGLLISPLNLTRVRDGKYYSQLHAPSSPFKLRVTGVDRRGFPFTRISPDRVHVSDIEIALRNGQTSYQVLHSGESQVLTLVASNNGQSSTFTVEAVPSDTSSPFDFYFNDLTTFNLESGATKNLELTIQAQGDVTEDDALSLLINMYDQAAVEHTNFLQIEIMGESEVEEMEFYNNGKGVQAALAYVVLLSFLTLGMLIQ